MRAMARPLSAWDAFVLACPQAGSYRAGWQRLVGEIFGHRCFFLYAERDGRIKGVLPLAQVKSLLFGHALAGLPFGVYGGVAAETEAAAQALEDEAFGWASRRRSSGAAP
ncbi:hypothetical protein PEC18_33925 [Paucibacter sp. O1-1]|nr:hypothetical protein [Paucibacter sp. O1-1]MDA3830691.1 hypothetical protein [Paucibacter sp. O1-1]